MKGTKWRIAAAGCLMAAALTGTSCSDETLQTESIYKRFGPEGKAYMSIDLNIPGNGAPTRAATYDDGEAKEYKVTQATIVLFGCKRSAEQVPANMYYRTACRLTWDYDPETGNPVDDQADQHSAVTYSDRITQWHSKVFQISNSSIYDDERLYAYALVNEPPAKIEGDGSAIYFGKKPDNTYNYTFNSSSTLATFMDMKFDINHNANRDFVMTPAPMATRGRNDYSSSVAISWLPEVYATNIYPTEAEALTNPATAINVERMAVKLTVKGDATMQAGKLTTDENVRYQYKDEGSVRGIKWCPDQRNTESYNMRHVSTAYLGYQAGATADGTTPTYRFLDDTPTVPGLYRILWGEDFNYDYTDFKQYAGEPGGLQRGPNNTQYEFGDASIDGNFYWNENTMNELGLTQGRTTRMTISIPFIVGKDSEDKDVIESFYTLSTENPDEIYLQDGNVRYYKDKVPQEETVTTKVADKTGHTVVEKVLSYVSQLTIYKDWKDGLSAAAKAEKDADLLKVTMFNCAKGQPGAPYQLPGYGYAWALISLNESNASLTAADKTSFATAFEPADVEEGTTGGTTYKHSENKLDKAVNEAIKFKYYVGGIAYYRVLVRHFGDDEVADYVKTEGSSYDKVYPKTKDGKSRAENYLGRYGMVRNTWYTITLTGVRHIGYSDDAPLIYDTPDDEVDNYLSVKILVNKWARRGQTNTL